MSELVIRLRPDLERKLSEAAEREGLPLVEYVENALDALVLPTAVDAVPSAWDEVHQLWQQLPEEELARLPEDGADQHDHYVYGIPKREV